VTFRRHGAAATLRSRLLATRWADNDGWRYTLASQKRPCSEEVNVPHPEAWIFSMTSGIFMIKRFRTPTRQGSGSFIPYGFGSLGVPLLPLLIKLISFVQNPDPQDRNQTGKF
jgi:hypothetical protein